MKKIFLSALPSSIQEFLHFVTLEAGKKNVKAFLVGGVVRDICLGVVSTDVDIVIEADVLALAPLWAKKTNASLTMHEKFHTAALGLKNNLVVDLVSARRETYSKPGALPDVVLSNLKDDLRRRDFSINAMAASLNANDLGVVYDPFEGGKDLMAKIMRILHSSSFEDDPTRILRAVRYAVRFGFVLDALTQDLLKQALLKDVFRTISPARYFLEFRRILEEADPVPALDFLASLGAVRYLPYRAGERAMLIKEGAVRWEVRLGVLLSSVEVSKAKEILTGFSISSSSKKIILDARQ